MRDRHYFKFLDFQFYQKRMMQQIKLTISSLVVVVKLMIMAQSELLMQSMYTLQVTYPHLLRLDIMMRQLSQVKLTQSLKMGMEAVSCLPSKKIRLRCRDRIVCKPESLQSTFLLHIDLISRLKQSFRPAFIYYNSIYYTVNFSCNCKN